MFKNLMNNYFYGKAGKGDFTIENLPQNRRQLFGEVLKVRWASMFGINLMYLIFWIPAIIWSFMNVVTMFSMLNAEAGMYGAADFSGLIMTYLLVLFPCIAITGPFSAGISYITRNWSRDEHSFVFSDFKDAVKGNWKQGLGVSIISGIMPLMVYVCWYFYSSLLSTSIFFVLPIAVVFLVALVWTLAAMIMPVMMVTYDLKFKDLIRNAVLLTLAKLPFALLIKLITLALPILGIVVSILIPSSFIYVVLVVGMLYLLYMPAFNKLVTAAYSNWLCESYLNPRIEGARTDIGLRPENWDDVEFIPQDDED